MGHIPALFKRAIRAGRLPESFVPCHAARAPLTSSLDRAAEKAIMTAQYTRTAITLHWAIALMIFTIFPLGLYMHDLPLSPDKLRLYSYHKWLGVTIFLLAVLRVTWRVRHRAPPLPAAMPGWEKLASHGVHYLLYALIFAVPLSGWLMSSAKGVQTVWFGVLPLPDLVAKNKELGDLLQETHSSLNFLMFAAVLAHAGAALKHHFIDRDDILTRMLPFPGRKP
jgi:cytochrome b561